MQLKSLNVYYFFLLFFAVGTAAFFLFQPFLIAIAAAAILATLFRKTYETLLRFTGKRPGLSALFTCLLVIVIIVTPITIVFSLAIGEANTLYHSAGESSTLETFISRGLTQIKNLPFANVLIDGQAFDAARILDQVRSFSQNALGLLQAAYQSVTGFAFFVFVMFFTLFYFLIDGKRALVYLMHLSPLRDEHDELLIQKFISISRATLKSTLVVGMIQGILGGIAFWIVGVPTPALWGLVMVFTSIVPVVGSSIIWIPGGLLLLLFGSIWQGVFILAVGAGIISVLDNILRPKLVGKDTQMHPLLVFFATIGGIAVFGLSGFIIGPIIMSLFLALGEIYDIEFHDQLKEYNQ